MLHFEILRHVNYTCSLQLFIIIILLDANISKDSFQVNVHNIFSHESICEVLITENTHTHWITILEKNVV